MKKARKPSVSSLVRSAKLVGANYYVVRFPGGVVTANADNLRLAVREALKKS